MHTWILVIMMYGQSIDSTGHTAFIEFCNQKSCEQARAKVVSSHRESRVYFDAVCVEK